ncbi:MAG: replication restart helicase PriA [Planctomycetota bacterium]
MSKLFDEPVGEQPAGDADGRVVGVAVASNVWAVYSYRWGGDLGSPEVGIRVRVPFGRGDRATLGVVVDVDRPAGRHKLKSVRERLDEHSRFTSATWELGEWISRYYLTPLGMTLDAMIPTAVGQKRPRSETVAYLASTKSDWPKSLGSRQRQVLDELLEAKRQGIEPLTLEHLRDNSGASRDTIRRLLHRELIRTESRRVTLESLQGEPAPDPFELNEHQAAVLETLAPKLDQGAGFSVTLLRGVTGSGKTEVYIRAIRRVIARGGQCILMVPEIALASQTTQRLIDRLPRVAVMHSQLTDAQRDFNWRRIEQGEASVVIGPRSAVFAPVKTPGLIIVDEEHESSYKQDTAPRYHGRDVAVKRASIEQIPVLLGSATPSMESWNNARQGRYELLTLASRVKGLQLPHLEIVPLRKEMEPGRIELIGRTLTHAIARTMDRGDQVILLMNRRGYASYVFCPSCQWIFECEQCTRAMVFHQATQLAMCHYCQSTAPLPERCPACSGKILLFGMGIQRIEGELARKFPTAVVARMDSDTMTSPKQFRKVLDDFASGEVDILLGTQMVAKGLDFPKVTLVGIASADTSLAIPDFRASERTFQLIVQVAGRAGRAGGGGQVVVQTLHGDEPSVMYASSHDFEGFARWELDSRKETNLPPFSRMVRFIARHKDLARAEEGANQLADRLRASLDPEAAMLMGPMPAAVKRIREQFRFQVLLITAKPGVVQQAIAGRMGEIVRDNPAEVFADVDPIALM